MPLPVHPLISLHLSRLGVEEPAESRALLDLDWPERSLAYQHSRWRRIEGLQAGRQEDPETYGLSRNWAVWGRWQNGPLLGQSRFPGWEASQNPNMSFILGDDRPNAQRDVQGHARDWASFLARTGPSGTVCGSLAEAEASADQVEVLCLDGARLRELPAWVGELSRLKVLLLSGNDLQSLPENIGNLPQLEHLELIGNRPLSSVPESIQALKTLKILRITGTQLPLDSWLESLPALEYLEANALPEAGPCLPETPLHLPQLRSLVGGWQPWVVELPSLRRLEGYLPADAMPLLRKARELNVLYAKTATSYVPPSLYALENLQVLAGFQNVERLPPGIGWLKQLQVLSLTGAENALVLPADLGELESLEYLQLGNCHLTRLPASMPALSRLKTLVFYGHNLRDLPIGFRELKALEMVDLGDGRIRQVPRVLSEFPRLRKLRLARNTIGKAPSPAEELAFLAGLPALEELDITTNAFSPTFKSQIPQRFPGIKVEG